MAAAKQKNVGGRVDPVPRRVDGVSGWLELDGKDPSRHYVFAYDLDQMCGRPYLASLGYQVEKYREGGVKVKNGDTGNPGDPIMFRGHVLMSISNEQRQAIDQDGQAWANRVEEKIVRRHDVDDLLRGIRHRQTMRITNHSTALSPDSVFDE